MKKIAYVFLTLGLVALICGLMMDTSGGTFYGKEIHNIFLGNTRISLILLGGFMFLGGIGIFSIHKVNQSDDEKTSEIEAKNKSKEFSSSPEGRKKKAFYHNGGFECCFHCCIFYSFLYLVFHANTW